MQGWVVFRGFPTLCSESKSPVPLCCQRSLVVCEPAFAAMDSDTELHSYATGSVGPSPAPATLSMPDEEKVRRWGRQYIRDCMVDCGFDKRERDIESRQLGMLWKSLHGAALLRQILHDQVPHEWPMVAASFHANFNIKFWDFVRHLEKLDKDQNQDASSSQAGSQGDDVQMPVLQESGIAFNHEAISRRKDSLAQQSPAGDTWGSELAESEELDDGFPVEVLDSDDDANCMTAQPVVCIPREL